MIDLNSLPPVSQFILVLGFAIGIASLVFTLRYPIMLILMKYSPDYREFIKHSIVQKNKKSHAKNNIRYRKSP
ncbi:MAG: hypothetical protein J5U17_07955 [Candidatus Methanoperedens sp.]|nr:hypothetical protein [Candidatus Methanoperedens sp.]MCE8426880.1 hypothetical protein [Candidatus Methanoperedens sp.]